MLVIVNVQGRKLVLSITFLGKTIDCKHMSPYHYKTSKLMYLAWQLYYKEQESMQNSVQQLYACCRGTRPQLTYPASVNCSHQLQICLTSGFTNGLSFMASSFHYPLFISSSYYVILALPVFQSISYFISSLLQLMNVTYRYLKYRMIHWKRQVTHSLLQYVHLFHTLL